MPSWPEDHDNSDPFLDPEAFWESVLSGEPDQVRRALLGLPAPDRQPVLAHLRRMADEPGWHPEQRRRAQAALRAMTLEPPPEGR